MGMDQADRSEVQQHKEPARNASAEQEAARNDQVDEVAINEQVAQEVGRTASVEQYATVRTNESIINKAYSFNAKFPIKKHLHEEYMVCHLFANVTCPAHDKRGRPLRKSWKGQNPFSTAVTED
ncbi:hypothetical protein L1887_30208 [Cichorium endivia]|nr:hypothetical protein L1887_30208 [Cichorium endivia]